MISVKAKYDGRPLMERWVLQTETENCLSPPIISSLKFLTLPPAPHKTAKRLPIYLWPARDYCTLNEFGAERKLSCKRLVHHVPCRQSSQPSSAFAKIEFG
ncbi:hypothetical protein ILYODFUR_022679 [Ilyodon furcidens]|uniref:Uncharacterized protein n=1 Tax=Ilyodon furcidens TaxID=33524 RepID=A0ABV0V594_9TELE